MKLLGDVLKEEALGTKLATFVHEHCQGQTIYTALVPSDTKLPSMTIGGTEDVEDHPEEWALYQKYIALLGISFDEFDDLDFLTCHDDAIDSVKVFDLSDLQ